MQVAPTGGQICTESISGSVVPLAMFFFTILLIFLLFLQLCSLIASCVGRNQTGGHLEKEEIRQISIIVFTSADDGDGCHGGNNFGFCVGLLKCVVVVE